MKTRDLFKLNKESLLKELDNMHNKRQLDLGFLIYVCTMEMDGVK